MTATDKTSSRNQVVEGVFRERLQAIVDWADLTNSKPDVFGSHGLGLLRGPVFDNARQALAAPAAPGEDALQQLGAARQWLKVLIDEFDLEPAETAFVITAGSPVGVPSQEMVRVTLAQSLAQIDACLEGAEA